MGKHLWTNKDEQRLRELRGAGVPVSEIAYQMDMSHGQIAARLHKMRKRGEVRAMPRGQRWSDEEAATLTKLWNAGVPTNEIAAILRRPISSVLCAATNIRNRMAGLGPVHRARQPKKQVGAIEIVRVVCAYFGVTMDEITGQSHANKLVKPRHIAAALCYKFAGRSLSSIGAILGGRDHTTIRYAIQIAPVKYPRAMDELERVVASMIKRRADVPEETDGRGSSKNSRASGAGAGGAATGNSQPAAFGC